MSHYYTKNELEKAVSKSESYSAVLRFFGRSLGGSAVSNIRNRIEEFEIDTTHFYKSKDYLAHSCNKKYAKDILIFDKYAKHRRKGNILTRCLLEIGVKYVCICGISDIWKGTKITLHVDHKDGNWRNNTPENLRFMCPNCHSQTNNFGHKNKS